MVSTQVVGIYNIRSFACIEDDVALTTPPTVKVLFLGRQPILSLSFLMVSSAVVCLSNCLPYSFQATSTFASFAVLPLAPLLLLALLI